MRSPKIQGGIRQRGGEWFAVFVVTYSTGAPEEWVSQPFTSRAAAVQAMTRRAAEMARKAGGEVREIV